jgi:hypothetical protein
MADEKATNLGFLRPRPRFEHHDLALAAFYPQTKSAIPLSAITGATPAVQPLHRRERDNPSPPENVAKPWKKPWDK